MLNYVNSFNLTTTEDNQNVALHLRQLYPTPFPKEDEDSISYELISSVLLDADTARSLASSILNALDKSDSSDDEDSDSPVEK